MESWPGNGLTGYPLEAEIQPGAIRDAQPGLESVGTVAQVGCGQKFLPEVTEPLRIGGVEHHILEIHRLVLSPDRQSAVWSDHAELVALRILHHEVIELFMEVMPR